MISHNSPVLSSAGVAVLLFSLVTGTVSENAAAQCATQWLPGSPVQGTNGWVWATTMWDPDGAGPTQPILVVGGEFTTAGSVPVNRIAAYDPGTGAWSALGSGFSGGNPATVSALVVLPNGDLVAGGHFTTAGGVSVNGIARWNGTAWSALGSGMSGPGAVPSVLALAVLPNGDLVAGGWFTTAGGVSVNGIARWNGTNWSALGSGMSIYMYPSVHALAVLPNGDLVAGGSFTTAGGVSANYIARWDGTSWSALGSGMNSTVDALTSLPNGDLVAGGWFTTAGGVSVNSIARWDGTSWSALGSGMGPAVHALTSLPNGTSWPVVGSGRQEA